MTILFTDEFPPTTERQISEFEASAGISIPRSYRQHLLLHNGGSPRPCIFDFQRADWSSSDAVHYFLGIGEGSYSLASELLLRAGRFPADLVPIASTPFADLVLLARDDSPRAGKVVYWFHEEEADEGEEPDERNIYPIADTFESFLAALHE